MRKHTKILALTVVLAAAGWFAGCNGTVDKEPNVVLEVATMLIPPVTATTTGGVCTFTIVAASATFNNKPKNSLSGTSIFPYNDVVLNNVEIDYTWDDDLPPPAGTPTELDGQVFGIAGTVPAGGSSAATFSVANGAVLSLPMADFLGVGGHTARLQMTFHGTTVGGDPVTSTTGGTLTVNSCPPAAP